MIAMPPRARRPRVAWRVGGTDQGRRNLLRKLLSALGLASMIAIAGCQPSPPSSPKPTQPPRDKTAATPKAEPTLEVAAPRVQLVTNGRVDSPSPALHVFLWGNPDTTDRDLRLASEAGVSWV